MCLVTGVGDEQLAFAPLGQSLCQFVERHYPIYCAMRSGSKSSRYQNTIQLYRMWSHRLKKFELGKEQQALSEALLKANKESIPILPLGSEGR
jgi:hypothetical protein